MPFHSEFLEKIKMQPHETFTGSYQPGDVEFLLKPVVIEMTPVEKKRRTDSVREETLFGHAQPGASAYTMAS